MAGAEVEGVEIGALPTEPPMSAPKPRPKAGLAMGEEWRTAWVLSILAMRWEGDMRKLLCVECKLCKWARREGVANLEGGCKCDEDGRKFLQDGQDWGRMRTGLVSVRKRRTEGTERVRLDFLKLRIFVRNPREWSELERKLE